MCSIGEDDFGDEGGLHAMIPDNENSANDEILYCKKCEPLKLKSKRIATIKLNFREPECDSCFLGHVRHKFRAVLGSSKILPKDADVLLYFNGSPESIVLLDMLQYGQCQNAFKRLHCNIKVLYIDETIIQPNNPMISDIREILKNYQFDTFIISIIPNVSDGPSKLNDFVFYEMNIDSKKNIAEKFIKDFENLKTITSKQDYLDKLRKNLLSVAANKLNCEFVFLSEISLNLATKLLTNISLGRGASTSSDVSLCDERFGNLTLVRPIKDLTKQEIDEYIKVRNIKLLNVIEHGEEFGQAASIQNLTKKFVLNLQKDYSSTISTVFRTGDKIAPNMNETEAVKLKCNLCKSNLDYFDSKTLVAIEFSRVASLNAGGNCTDGQLMDKLIIQNLNEINSKLFERNLCHSCRNIYNDCLNPELFL